MVNLNDQDWGLNKWHCRTEVWAYTKDRVVLVVNKVYPRWFFINQLGDQINDSIGMLVYNQAREIK